MCGENVWGRSGSKQINVKAKVRSPQMMSLLIKYSIDSLKSVMTSIIDNMVFDVKHFWNNGIRSL